MLRFLCKTTHHCRANGYINVATLSPSMALSLPITRHLSSDSDKARSFTLSYLINSCGLSPKSALSASKLVLLESPEQPDSVLSCFKKFGFSETQISEIIRKFPKLLNCNVEKTISPKVEFFRCKGASLPDLVKIFTSYPRILTISLENRIVGYFDILVELLESEDKAIAFVARNPWIPCNKAALLPNINTLRENGVPPSNITWLFNQSPLCIGTRPVDFVKLVEEVKEMGFNPVQLKFVIAMKVLNGMTKSKRAEKVDAYKRCGFSDKDIITAFKKNPWCLSISEDKIMTVIDFYVNKLGLDCSFIVNNPQLLGLSLKKRIIPRGAVVEFLRSNGLIKSDSTVAEMFKCTERSFLKKYVNCHKKAPVLVNLYNEKLLEAVCE